MVAPSSEEKQMETPHHGFVFLSPGVEVLFLEQVFRVGVEVSILSLLGGNSQLRMAAPGVGSGQHDSVYCGASA